MKHCNIGNCDHAYYAKGFCQMHWIRNHKYGDPNFTKFHNMHDSPTWRSWKSVKIRCKPTYRQHRDYYDRGIRFDPRWEDFKNFFADMGTCPPGLTLDRIDNDKGYFPGNVRWATRQDQQRNQRARRGKKGTNVRGVYYNARYNKWYAQIRPDYNTKTLHLGMVNTQQEAIVARKEAELKYWGFTT